uniref:HsdM family class I SAM-dependent methyltransferase n=1 Tax=Candidatus Borrarchaeum sp. TaxID=2846742 RepID=UPI00257A37BD
MAFLELFLKDLGLSGHVTPIDKNRHRYSYDLGAIDFACLDSTKDDFSKVHNEVWCENKTEFFVALFEKDMAVHICDSKTRPYLQKPVEKAVERASIDSFNYGENTRKAQRYMSLFRKESIDAGDCLAEIKKKIQEQKRTRVTVDDDLLTNLEKLKNTIIRYLEGRPNNKEIAQKIIDRCLFIRFLEDRAGRNDLKNLLSDRSQKIDALLRLFDSYTDSLNGDIFEKGDIPEDINVKILYELDRIFGKAYTYVDRQKTLVPYDFERIPIILISNIYEKFLAENKEKEGIVFTPENVVEYTLSKVFESNFFHKKIKEKNISILDPACGSGVFLVKSLEKVVDIREKEEGKLSIDEKAEIVKKSLFGIDKNNDALRIAALSLYLKIIENESAEVVNERLFGNNENHFMFPGLKRNKNLVEGDSLFDQIYEKTLDNAYEKTQFDVILGNPPWGYDFRYDWQKKFIKRRWPEVSKYQSSQIFLLAIKKWMKKETICGMVVNLSNFTSSEASEFRKSFLQKYSLHLFAGLSRIRCITFGRGSESACILVFGNTQPSTVQFVVPELHQFSLQTGAIIEGPVEEVSYHQLKKEDYLWHIYALGFSIFTDLVKKFDRCEYTLDSFMEKSSVGIMKYSKKNSGMSRDQFYEEYSSPTKKDDSYFPMIDSLKDVKPFHEPKFRYYFKWGPHLDRRRDIELFTGEKLVITRNWPVKAFLSLDTKIFDGNFCIFKPKSEYRGKILRLFEAIFNSKLAHFYLGVK